MDRRHPQNSTQGAVMEVLSGTPEWSAMRQLHVDGLKRYPRFMQRVVEPALPIGPDLTVRNVPGMTSAVTFAGSTVDGVYYSGPLPGCHITTILFSYNGRCHIGINCDEEVFGKYDELVTCLGEGLDEVLDLQRIQDGSWRVDVVGLRR